MQADAFIEHSKPFIKWMLDWQAGLTSRSLAEIIKNEPEKVGIVSVDVIKGFCTVGPLASPRIDGIVAPITRLFELAWNSGIRDIALTQDTHPENAVEFMSYAPHCIRGTEESETVEPFKALPFFNQLTVIEKNSINSGLDEEFDDWLRARPQIKNWIVVGDCTDLCTHQLAMHIRISANQNQVEGVRVILPVNAVDTYDLPVNIAQEIGAIPHDGQFLHLVFLYHMMLNGVEIATEITE